MWTEIHEDLAARVVVLLNIATDMNVDCVARLLAYYNGDLQMFFYQTTPAN